MAATILIVEDDPDILRILAHTLTNAGYQVISAAGGEDALQKIKEQKVDLVLTDLAMPKVSGVEVIQQIKRDPETQHVPCIAVTSYVWDQIGATAREVGCDGYIPKPFNNRQLLHDIQKYLKPLA